MSYFDDLPMIDAQRKALEAGRDKFPGRVKSAPGSCLTEFTTMLEAYDTAAEAAFSGTEQEWIDAMTAATAAHGAWHSCFYHPDPVDVVFPE
jgi:hypothetical protein